ncbi:MAG: PVC-type heme-binding CxxCH protein [Aureliella sp.]
MKLFCGLALLLGVWLLESSTAQEIVFSFPELYNSEPSEEGLLSATEALECLHLPAGFSATLFASEPEVQNPIAATVDARGRVWIAENYTYAERSQRFDLNLRDRVVVLDDEDGDGVAEKRTVFSDTLQMLTGIEVGQAGVWLMCPPQLLFVPDADGDLIPDGPPQVKLDGFHVARENYHNFANGLSWGPDSWLYGRCGASCPGELGLPGTPDDQRVPLRGGMWRFNPQRQVVEALNQGTTNPWGHDWNAVGELFFINTVNGHLWHSIPGAHYVRPHSLDANPHSYELIDMHADHWHFDTGKSWTDSRDGAANDYGGGHAHVGMMIYQEPTWPPEYQQRLLTINMHGRRVNVERLDAEGSGYVGRHEPDIFLTDDTWFRGMELLPLPDGNVLLLDWSDTGECHDSTGVHRTSGRIFKLIFDGAPSIIETSLLRDDPLNWAQLQRTGSEWQARRARELLRGLAVRSSAGEGEPISSFPNSKPIAAGSWALAKYQLAELLESNATTPLRLRALWSLWAMDELKQDRLLSLCDDSEPEVRSWAIRLLGDHWGLDTTTGQRPLLAADWEECDSQIEAKLVAMAASEPNASVRLTLASTLQRMRLVERVPLASALMTHAEDAQDHNLPLMVWYGIMPLGGVADKDNASQSARLISLAELAADSTWPRTRRLIVRRLAEELEAVPEALEQLIAMAVDSEDRPLAVDIVRGAALGLAGRRQVAMPPGWSELQQLIGEPSTGEFKANDLQNSELQSALNDLNVLFGDGVAIEELKRVVSDESALLDTRRAALSSLVDSRAEGLRELCLRLLKQRYLNEVAARGLAIEVDDEVGKRLLASYRAFTPLERPALVSMLASRRNWGEQLLKAVGAGEIDRTEITPFHARQLSSFHDQRIDELLAEHWGQARETDAERTKQMQTLRLLLASDRLADADPKQGRALFDKNCAGCHTLYGEGGKLAPDLTGAGRGNLDYLLENIVDPSAVVTKEFRTTVAMLEDGRVLTGLLTSRNDDVITLATQEQTLRVPVEEIAELKQSATSTMPDGLLSQLSDSQILNLFAYLQSKRQVDKP